MSPTKNFIIIFLLFISFYVFSPFAALAESIPDRNHSSLSVSSSVPADGKTTAIITITLQDTSGNPIAGHRVILEDSSNSGATITSISDTTDASGHALFSIRSTKAQKDNINVTDITSNTTFYNLGEITFTSEGCFDSAPGSTPRLTSAIVNNATQIKLSWTEAANPVTRYLISYGVASGQYIYGNPNVGAQGTTSYTIGSLSPGKKYYFVVQAINGCAPGRFSNEISAIAGGATIDTPTLIPTPTIEPTSETDNQIKITPSDIPILSQPIQPTISSIPTQTPTTDDSKAKALFFISLSIVVIGSIGNLLYWKHKTKTYKYKSIHGFEENQ